MGLKYEQHLNTIELASLPVDALDMKKLETILSDAFYYNSDTRHYHTEGSDRWYSGHFKAINMKDSISHPTNLSIDFNHASWIEGQQKQASLKIESIEMPIANISPIGTRTTVEMRRIGQVVQSATYTIETVAWTAGNIYERLGHHAIAFGPVLADMDLTHRELSKFDMPYVLKLIEVFTEEDMSKIGDTKVI